MPSTSAFVGALEGPNRALEQLEGPYGPELDIFGEGGRYEINVSIELCRCSELSYGWCRAGSGDGGKETSSKCES